MQGDLRLLYTFSVYPSEAGLVSKTLRETLETDTLSSAWQYVVTLSIHSQRG